MFSIIVPPVTCHKLDPHSGFPFIPHMAGYLASAINNEDYEVQIIDAFSNNPEQAVKYKDFMFLGMRVDEIVNSISNDSKGIFIYARTIIDYEIIRIIISEIKKKLDIKIILFENTQCVDALALEPIYKDIFELGVDFLIFGEPERRIRQILDQIITDRKIAIKGVAYKINNETYFNNEIPYHKDLDDISFPLWEKWNLNGYWRINYSHPPSKQGDRFVTLITSRGCPFRCTFCVAPEINPTWRYRSAKNVVDEMEYFHKKLNVNDFHISDFNPTIRENRFIEICNEILKRNLDITWKIAQGTKIETIKHNGTINLFYRAGCRFLSFSPESGSKEVMKNIVNKPFNHKRALEVTKRMYQVGIRTQACFVVGMPGERFKHRLESLIYMIKLSIAGVDEVACYIITPVPGAKIFGHQELGGFKSLSECSHTPTWRKDFVKLYTFRMIFYLTFIFIKSLIHPIASVKLFFRIFFKNFETKMEMSIFKKYRLIRQSMNAKMY